MFNSELDNAVEIYPNIYWVGTRIDNILNSNTFLIKEGDEAVIIDGGARSDFSTVMMKILQTGIEPKNIKALIYHHYDPDLCGSLSNFLDMCNNDKLVVISSIKDKPFLSYYIHNSMHYHIVTIESLDFKFQLGNRVLKFVPTPYAHSFGAYTTYDSQSKILFSSDIFGSIYKQKNLFVNIKPVCENCKYTANCKERENDTCPLEGIINFHKIVMPSCKSLRYAINQFKSLDINLVAPQHGFLIDNKAFVNNTMQTLKTIDGVGIDGILKEG